MDHTRSIREKKLRIVRRIAPLALLALLIVGARVPYSPLFQTIPLRDSGVYLYIGREILDGKIPYRDAWDNKPPAIYYIDALGLSLGRGSTWGVWGLQVLAVALATGLGFTVLNGAFGRAPAIFGSTAWLLGLVLLLGPGNLTEEFALPLQFLALYLCYVSERQGWRSGRCFAIGMTFGLAFLLRPNLVGVHLAILLFLLWPGGPPDGVRRRWRDAGLVCMAAMGVVLSAAMYFAVRGALTDFLDAAFRFNFAYHASTPKQMLRSVFQGVRYTSQSGLPIIALAAWPVAALGYGSATSSATKAVVNLSLIGLPIEFLLASLSGRSYLHYFVAWLPVLAMLSGVFARTFATICGRSSRRVWKWDVAVSAMGLAILTLAMSLAPLFALFHRATSMRGRTTPQREAVDLITRTTAPADYVLIWGFEPSVNFVAQRESPTRFIYQLPLYVEGYQSPRMIGEFLDDIRARKPILIIDASSSDDVIPPIDPIARKAWEPSQHIRVLPDMDRVFDYIISNYRRLATVGHQQQAWSVYQDRRRRTNSP